MSDLILDGHKLWLLDHRDRLEAWMRGERIAPITIDMALTRSCTAKCVYCYSMLQNNDIKKITMDVIKRFFDDVADIGVKAVSFVSDGESTCSPHIYDAILYGRKNGLDIALGTIGHLLNDERLEEILPALTYLRFNISAAMPKRYAEIHGCEEMWFEKVCNTIKKAVDIKKKNNLAVTIGLQMVFLPDFVDQVLPLAELGKNLGVDYLVIKHCSDDESGSLGVDYDRYNNQQIINILKQAENFSTEKYLVKAKWSKILSEGKRCYARCYGAPFFLQVSGSGLVAPCGMLFNMKYKDKFHIGNIADSSFKKIWQSDRYWEVMNYISSPGFDARSMCGCLCIQHKINEFLWDLKEENIFLKDLDKDNPNISHRNFL